MLAKRIVPCLDIKDGQTVKGTNFVNLRQAGDPVELGRAYSEQGADELVFLDITASHEGRKTFTELVKRIAANINIPFTVKQILKDTARIRKVIKIAVNRQEYLFTIHCFWFLFRFIIILFSVIVSLLFVVCLSCDLLSEHRAIVFENKERLFLINIIILRERTFVNIKTNIFSRIFVCFFLSPVL